jgi:hypothetical protein
MVTLGINRKNTMARQHKRIRAKTQSAFEKFLDKVTPANRSQSSPDWTRQKRARNHPAMTRARWRQLMGNPALVWAK